MEDELMNDGKYYNEWCETNRIVIDYLAPSLGGAGWYWCDEDLSQTIWVGPFESRELCFKGAMFP